MDGGVPTSQNPPNEPFQSFPVRGIMKWFKVGIGGPAAAAPARLVRSGALGSEE